MNKETEVKVLNIDVEKVKTKLVEIGAKQTYQGKFVVDWLRPIGIGEDEDPWFLRVRSREGREPEVTWKGLTEHEVNVRKKINRKVNQKHHTADEINFNVSDFNKMRDLFIAIGLEHYARQEKIRTSFELNDISFDIDEYPGIPPFLEVEAFSKQKVEETLEKLDLKNYKRWAAGERILIQQEYKKDWYWMEF